MVFQSTTATRPGDDTYYSSSSSLRSKQKYHTTATAARQNESRHAEHHPQIRQPAAAVSSARLLPQKWHKNNASSSTVEEREDIGVQSSSPLPAPTNSNTNKSVATFVAAIEAAHKKKQQKADSTSKNVVQDRKINQLLCHQRTRTAGSFSHNSSSSSSSSSRSSSSSSNNSNSTSPTTACPLATNEERKMTSNSRDSLPLPAKATMTQNRTMQNRSNKESDQQFLSAITAPTTSMTSSITTSSSSLMCDVGEARMATASSPPIIGRPTLGQVAAKSRTNEETSPCARFAVNPDGIVEGREHPDSEHEGPTPEEATRAPRSRLGVPGTAAGWRATHKNRTSKRETPSCAPPAVAKQGETVEKLQSVMIAASRSIRPSSSSISATTATAVSSMNLRRPQSIITNTIFKRRLADVREHRRQRYELRMITQQQQQQQHDREGNQQGRQQQGEMVPQQQQQPQQQPQPSDEETPEEDSNFQARTMMKTSSSNANIDRRDTIPRTSTCTSKDTTVAIRNKKPHHGIHTKKRNGHPPEQQQQQPSDEKTTEDDPDVQARAMMKTSRSNANIDRRDTIPRTSTCTSKDTTVAIRNKKPHHGIHTKKRNIASNPNKFNSIPSQ